MLTLRGSPTGGPLLRICYISIFSIIFLHHLISGLPVKKQVDAHRFADEEFDRMTANDTINEVNSNDHNRPADMPEELGIEYNRYLNEVVEALESDPEFRKKLENASESDIRSGKIAQELEYVNHQVRSKLDELKRTELDRLRELAKRQYELSEGKHIPDIPGHVDHNNPHTFEIHDLHKLIVQVTNDLEEVDKKRREVFKEYELQKRYERDQKLSLMTDEEKEEYLKKEKEEIESRKSQIKDADLHRPGSKKQLEEVWQEQDHMGNAEFDPKAFFVMHDLDGNHALDEEEVKALFLKELDKLYKEGVPQNDLMERAEEMERMREHVFREADLNRDRLISWDEFYQMTKRQEFTQDPGWKPIDQNQVYSQREMEEYERHRQAEVDRLVREGRLPAVPPQHAQYGHPNQYHPGQPMPQHPNMPNHIDAQHYNPGNGGIQYVPGNMPPVQVSPQHYQAMHEPNNIPQNNFHVDAQKQNIHSAPPHHQQQYQQQVQYNQGGNVNQNQHVNYQVPQGQNSQQNQAQTQNIPVGNQNQGNIPVTNQNQGNNIPVANQNQGNNIPVANQNQGNNIPVNNQNQGQQNHFASQGNQGNTNQGQYQQQGNVVNQAQYQQQGNMPNQGQQGNYPSQGNQGNVNQGQANNVNQNYNNQGQVNDPDSIPKVQNNNIGQGQAYVKEIPMNQNQKQLHHKNK